MDIEVYILMSPLHVGTSFSAPTSSDRLPSLPAHSPCSSLLPALSSLPAHSSLLQLTPSLLPMGNEQFSMYWESPPPLWAKGLGGELDHGDQTTINEYLLGSRSPLQASFGVPTTSLVRRLTPLTPKLLPSLPKH